MANNLKEYARRFAKRNFSLNNSLRKNGTKETGNDTTIMDLLLLSALPIITLVHLVEKVSGKRKSK